MFLNPRVNLFNFHFTKNFIPQEIIDKYKPYLTKVVGSPIREPIDYINYTIQGVNLPGLGYDFVEQVGKYGRTRKYRTTTHPQEMYDKTFTVTMKMTDGFVNYWIMYDLLAYYYKFSNTDKYIPDQRMEIIDSDGNVIVNVEFQRMLYTSIGELNFNFSTNTPDFTTFDLTFVYNEINISKRFDVT